MGRDTRPEAHCQSLPLDCAFTFMFTCVPLHNITCGIRHFKLALGFANSFCDYIYFNIITYKTSYEVRLSNPGYTLRLNDYHEC